MRMPAIALLAALLALGLQPAHADARQDRMDGCNATADQKTLQGEARKLYIKGCLGGRKQLSTQQSKLKQCSADARLQRIKGEARVAFMKRCLGGDATGLPIPTRTGHRAFYPP